MKIKFKLWPLITGTIINQPRSLIKCPYCKHIIGIEAYQIEPIQRRKKK